jgi:hypothetical protein
MPFLNLLINPLVNMPSPEMQIFDRRWPSFKVCGYIGTSLAVVLAIASAFHLGLSLWMMAGIGLVAMLTFLALAMATKIIVGEERLIFYHDFIAVVTVTSILLWLLGHPILPYLDLTVLGIGAFLACGRVGCLMVGCCHGRPSRFGVCYRQEHVAAGFTPHFVGVRLFPIQAVESLWVFCIVLVGGVLIWRGYAPGEATSWFVVTYCPARFFFEFARWRPSRDYFRGLTQPQWTSLILMAFVLVAELIEVLSFHLWHVVLTGCLIVLTVAVALRGRSPKTNQHQLLDVDHAIELAKAMELVTEQSFAPVNIRVGCTSLGIQVSASKIKSVAGEVDHYALSSRNESLNEEAARVLARLIFQLKRKTGSKELISGAHGVFHLLIHPFNH